MKNRIKIAMCDDAGIYYAKEHRGWIVSTVYGPIVIHENKGNAANGPGNIVASSPKSGHKILTCPAPIGGAKQSDALILAALVCDLFESRGLFREQFEYQDGEQLKKCFGPEALPLNAEPIAAEK